MSGQQFWLVKTRICMNTCQPQRTQYFGRNVGNSSRPLKILFGTRQTTLTHSTTARRGLVVTARQLRVHRHRQSAIPPSLDTIATRPRIAVLVRAFTQRAWPLAQKNALHCAQPMSQAVVASTFARHPVAELMKLRAGCMRTRALG